MKKVISALLIALFCVISFTACDKVDTNISNYEQNLHKIGNASEFMPDLEELGNCEDIRYSYKFTDIFPFCTETVSVFAKYDVDNYIAQKKAALDSFSFLDSSIISDGQPIIPVSEFKYNSYDFKIAIDKEADIACQSFIIVGFDDANSQIAYCYFYDPDRDFMENISELKDLVYWNDFTSNKEKI